MNYMAIPKQKNPCPGVMTFTIGRPFLGHHYFTFCLSESCLRVEKEILKKYINFTLFTQKLPSLWVWSPEFRISCLLTL